MRKCNSILVIAAHPDDEVLGCGGTIARLTREGKQVFLSILGEGITSRYERREETDLSLVEGIKRRSREAAELLGAQDLFLFDFPDNRFDTIPFLEIVKEVEKLIAQLAPAVIYTHHEGDLNIDHSITHRAVLTATRPVQGMPIREVYAFEIPSSTDWAFRQSGQSFRPNVFLDITGTLKTKIQAFSIYETEVRRFPHPRSLEAIEANARRWGSVTGCNAAEAFELIRSIR
jgi:LmbE family N-acetylglucosaminyl deacetylase